MYWSGKPGFPSDSNCPTFQTALLPQFIMTKLIGFAAFFMFTSIGQAQAQSAAGDAMPKHPRAMQYNERQLYEAEQARKRRVLVHCRDGSRHIARVCRRHGGVA